MPTAAWEQASRNKGDEVIHMKKLMPIYSYKDERSAVLTDKKFCIKLRDELSRSKGHFSDAVDWLYRANIEDRHFERLKDDFDILLDEIEVKHNIWDERIPQEFLEKIMEYDWDLMQKTWALENDLKSLIQDLYKATKQKIIDKESMDKIKISMDVINEKVDDITIMFKEREAAFDITKTGFRDSFQKIRERIRRSV